MKQQIPESKNIIIEINFLADLQKINTRSYITHYYKHQHQDIIDHNYS
jgi:hypothetical protein